MAIKSKIELTTELPVLIKSKGLVSPTKTTADTLRQMLQDIIDSMGLVGEGVPVGAICEWFSTVDTIPQYWVLCDGRFGTPDLRDKFVIGAGGAYPVHDVGGSASHNHGGTIGGHALTIPEMPSHTHGYDRAIKGREYDTHADDSPFSIYEDAQTSSAGGGLEHTHPLNLSSATTLPPYHSLVYMMFKGPSFTEDTEVPSPVLNLTVSLQTISSFLVSWTASSDNVGVVGYDVYVNGAYRDTTSSLSYSVTGLDPATTYVINVKARDASGNTSVDATINGTTIGMPAATTTYYRSNYVTSNPAVNDYVIYKNASNTNVVKTLSRSSNVNLNLCEGISHYGIVEFGAGAVPCTPSSTTLVYSTVNGSFVDHFSGYISRTTIYYKHDSSGNPNYIAGKVNDRHFQVGDTGQYKIRLKGRVQPEGNNQGKVTDIWVGKNQQGVVSGTSDDGGLVGLQRLVTSIGGLMQPYDFDNEITIPLNAGDYICIFARLVSGQGLSTMANNIGYGLTFYLEKVN